jgi:unsaturated rhamnogalacturonyl hydrolase
MKQLLILFFALVAGWRTTAQPVVLLDAYYNHETKKDASGKEVHWHYAWDDFSDGGFGELAKVFTNQHAVLKTIFTPPSKNDLNAASVYIIVDPDHVKDNPNPHYMNTTDASTIASWVKKGGVLLLMANDSLNCDIDHINMLSNKFGITFTNQSVNMVKGSNYEMGKVYPTKENNIFSPGLNIFMKDVSALKLSSDAIAIATNGSEPVIAYATYGRGYVIAVGDPWLYNEYIHHRRLPSSYQNVQAAEQLVKALIAFSLKK